ncbi:phosphoadenosine phosphosulfate reductase [Dyadobacter sp. BE34]|uniref:Adenosine 5'-phosphosulfate reductase n=1 Tax=Dyadobacter fermentans TaxID=94254 RepID=A0ABU1R1C0_9BACT|nr:MULTISPECIES: phosphoadenylyl-sulfate reductase [Dyadobacter]MDR6807214.1 phosphoadenosine phosphosulfate reductase [Dyadobacter fermentans]MDR7044955.1 phosphoadenosine phosphosulfate reductase [Dyadobacter sp. BE242]MDR7199309.1 phosphoadenosine phosphosulfate reductase [Dyadobacter sp. BE34]MDR7217269.1 phosphoadenosine phosphosulfate reductase [Dyadobacter sp. BE31]MDR7265202.1 phosphoadenosine phosphosulfate reductase [Dyadobacter sp. BE32]
MNETLASLNAAIEGKSEVESLSILADLFPGEVVFSTSLGYEDQVISDLILKNNINIGIFTLDTGRLFAETYMTLQKTNNRYDTKIKVYYPQTDAVENLVSTKGPLSFYESIENRKECCFIRKVEPLNRALKGAKIWVTGIRAEQSGNRHDMPRLEWDEAHQLFKFHPILDWTFEEVKQYVKSNGIPYNPLHDKGFVSIGCAPCTRAIQEGEDFRAGRWWWEDESKKECGLHAK